MTGRLALTDYSRRPASTDIPEGAATLDDPPEVFLIVADLGDQAASIGRQVTSLIRVS